MTISVGERLPEATFTTMGADGPEPVTTAQVFGGKKVAAFAVPGAFTPTCHSQHLPGFLREIEAFKAKGVETVACIAVNDVFVMQAWAEQCAADGKILFLADGNGDFTRAAGMELDVRAVGLGDRSHRYAMLVDDGVVTALNVEDAPASAIMSSAEELLKAL